MKAHSVMVLDCNWCRIQRRTHARSYYWWAVTPLLVVRVTWRYTGSRLKFHVGREPGLVGISVGGPWTLFLEFQRRLSPPPSEPK